MPIAMKNIAVLSISLLAVAFTACAKNSPEVGSSAPDFTLTAASGETHSLSDFRGKFVVLEWVNHKCPFVVKHYKSGNMQELQETYTGKDVVWLTICSSAPGKQGYMSADEILSARQQVGANATAYLMDPSGEVGKKYGATATPEMFVINPDGEIIYHGAIDSIRSTSVADVEKAEPYVAMALDAAMAGKEVPVKTSRPYGCSVKY